MLEAAWEALLIVLHPSRIGFMFLGIFIGIFVGLLPGLSGTVGMSLLLPFVFGLDPFVGMALLIGMVAVVHTGDTFPSILLGIPGTSGSQATIMDGYPLAKQGQASRAMGASFFCSMVGGVVGGISLYLMIPFARPLISAFSSPELFMLTMLGLSMAGLLAGKSPIKGIISGLLGLLIGSIGSAPAVAEYRYTFGSLYLSNGVSLPVVALAIFAFPIMITMLSSKGSITSNRPIKGGIMKGVMDSLRNKFLVFRSAVIGTLIGFVPGLGGSVVDWIAYGAAQKTVKNNTFGQGDIRGVIAPESANNAKEGGSLVPTLLFGIPGSGTTAILLGGLTLMGLEAGPRMLGADLPVTLSIVWTLVFANIFGALLCMALIRPISKISFIPSEKIVPFLLVLLILGAYQSNFSWGDIIVFIAIGLLGYMMTILDWPRPPLLIGFVLAISAERYYWISIERYGWEWLTNPIVIGIGIVIAFLLTGGMLMKRFSKSVESKGGNMSL
ncbi:MULTISPECIES: tripartite tricarboxylate transporter permease [Shouchella]|uniref:Tripartite tricarboxylate transporter permease n=3 Tax=Bacillaceae TaxID=186817 RepID=A0ABY7W4L8_9BACI|nr:MULTISPECIES: tripartite tricarboxylate transporter permease [Shouchella]MED4129327.1 tripartite tricarboxylate transporter permease [Shouchella miscanthi]WDF02426.1 tripartite tricarboxylate transporter permease [Shouchella hunanensis]